MQTMETRTLKTLKGIFLWGCGHRKRKKEVASEVGLVTDIFPLISLNLWLAGSKFSESWLVYKIS